MPSPHLPPYWRQRLLAVIGAPRNRENLRFLEAWQAAEGGTAAWNPLNTTLKLPGSSDYNTVPVQNYPRATWGVCATALTLTNGHYGMIVGSLQAGTKTAEQITEDCREQLLVWGTNPDVILSVLRRL